MYFVNNKTFRSIGDFSRKPDVVQKGRVDQDFVPPKRIGNTFYIPRGIIVIRTFGPDY